MLNTGPTNEPHTLQAMAYIYIHMLAAYVANAENDGTWLNLVFAQCGRRTAHFLPQLYEPSRLGLEHII